MQRSGCTRVGRRTSRKARDGVTRLLLLLMLLTMRRVRVRVWVWVRMHSSSLGLRSYSVDLETLDEWHVVTPPFDPLFLLGAAIPARAGAR